MGQTDPTNSVKEPKEVVALRIRLQSHYVYLSNLTMLQFYKVQYTVIHKIHTDTKLI